MNDDQISLGFVETAGLVMAIEVADAMAKAAEVKITLAHKVDGLRVAVICRGDVASCQAAVGVGAELARTGNALICSNVIPSPADPEETLTAMLKDIPAKKAARKAARKARLAAARAEEKQEDETPAPVTAAEKAAEKAAARRPRSKK